MLSLARRKLSFALQLPHGYSCPPATLNLRPYSFILAPCSTFQAVVRKSLFGNTPIDLLEQTSSKHIASPSGLRRFVTSMQCYHPML